MNLMTEIAARKSFRAGSVQVLKDKDIETNSEQGRRLLGNMDTGNKGMHFIRNSGIRLW